MVKLFSRFSKVITGKKLCEPGNHQLIMYTPKISHDDPICETIGFYCTVCGYDTHGDYANR